MALRDSPKHGSEVAVTSVIPAILPVIPILLPVIPAQAGIQALGKPHWIPAFTGMVVIGLVGDQA